MLEQLPVVFSSWQHPTFWAGLSRGVGGPDPEGARNRGQGKVPGLTRGEQIRAKFPRY
jgi:hypothetical protein